MNESIESVTTAALSLALDAASLRQQAITSNMANINSPGYAPLEVSFEDQLEGARRELEAQGRLDGASLLGLKPVTRLAVSSQGFGPGVSLDVEAVKLAQNAVHFQALLRGLSKHYAMLSSAVSDGKK